MRVLRSFLLALAFLCPLTALAQQPAPDAGAPDSAASQRLELGTIDFPTSGTVAAQDTFLKGALALHSFWYEEARDHFQQAQQLDPALAMAYWGEAMTHDHPLWGPLGQHDSTAARAVLTRMDEQDALKWTARERGYVEALRTLYEGEGDLAARRAAYAEAMRGLTGQYPEDDEAALFHALAEMAVAEFDLDEAGDVVPVAARIEAVYQRRPKHPGALHYLIHVYDSPASAPLGLRPARTYADVAPAASHALHMPSHIFRQLGLHEKVVASNEEAYAASVAWQKRTGRPLSARDYHAFRWLFEAHLALGHYEEARTLLQDLDAIKAEAKRRNEDLSRLSSVAERLRTTYDRAVEEGEAQSK